MQDRSGRGAERGFSLVELLVVITIIGILATTVTIKVIGALSTAKINKAKTEIRQIKDAVGLFRITVGKMPDSLEDLRQPHKGFDEGFIDAGKDPWGNDYEFERQGNKVKITSYGADGGPGGEGEEADIDSDHLTEDAEGGTGGSTDK